MIHSGGPCVLSYHMDLPKAKDPNPTKSLWASYRNMFQHFNDTLFGGKLPEPVLNFSRHSGSRGFFAWDRWQDSTGQHTTHEISLNPDCGDRDPREVASTLVHEMVHLWQQEAGTPGRGGYHNKEWAEMMDCIGLPPVSFDNPGKKTGCRVSHTIQDGGPFDAAFQALPVRAMPWHGVPFGVELLPPPVPGAVPVKVVRPPSLTRKNKVRYVCGCGNKVWGKPGMALRCNDCVSDFVEG